MYTIIGAVIGFLVVLVRKSNAGLAAILALLGLVLGVIGGLAFGVEDFSDAAERGEFEDGDFTTSNIIALVLAALPGVAGAFFDRSNVK